jgi:hypothetical protein
MTRHKRYAQCSLRRPLKEGRQRDPYSWIEKHMYDSDPYEVITSWIPESIAKKGNRVRLKNYGSEKWSNDWEVMHVWSIRDGDHVEVACMDHRHQRKVSDR